MDTPDNKELFAHKGLRNTKNRNLVYNVLDQAVVPVTAERIFLKLKETDTAINLSTVYRILEIFVDKGIVQKLNWSDDNKAVFELNRCEHKHYLVCISCKQVVPVGGCPLEQYEKLLQDKMKFAVTGHKLEIFGYCENCQERK